MSLSLHPHRVGLLRLLALALCLGLTSSASAATLKMLSLRCVTTQDDGREEVKLRVRVDFAANHYRTGFMAPGGQWILNREFDFAGEVRIWLFDRDPFGAVDLVGTVVINPFPTGGIRTRVFNFAGARYELRYVVFP